MCAHLVKGLIKGEMIPCGFLPKVQHGDKVYCTKHDPAKAEPSAEYKAFLKQYGRRPPDIVFAVCQKDKEDALRADRQAMAKWVKERRATYGAFYAFTEVHIDGMEREEAPWRKPLRCDDVPNCAVCPTKRCNDNHTKIKGEAPWREK